MIRSKWTSSVTPRPTALSIISKISAFAGVEKSANRTPMLPWALPESIGKALVAVKGLCRRLILCT